jgi:hypothetical protein
LNKNKRKNNKNAECDVRKGIDTRNESRRTVVCIVGAKKRIHIIVYAVLQDVEDVAMNLETDPGGIAKYVRPGTANMWSEGP